MYEFTNFNELRAKLNNGQPIAFDTETVKFYGRIRLAQFYQQDWDRVCFVEWPNTAELIVFLTELKSRDIKPILQNVSYDVSTIQDQAGARWQPEEFEDTFYLARLAYPHLESFSLDDLMTVVLGYDPYAKHNLDKAKLQKSDWGAAVLKDEQLMYAAIDVYHLLDVYDAVKEFEADISYKLDILSLKHALDFQRNGMPVLRDKVHEKYSENLAEIKKINLPINPNSYVQVRPYVGTDNSDALGLGLEAINGNTRAADVLAARRLIKQNSFLDKFESDDGRIYGKFAPSARSGRFTCKDQNLQQLPRKLKGVFGVDDDGDRVLLYADYPQLELRTIAAIAEERKLIELFKHGGDPHGEVAALLFGRDWTKDDRQITKTYNFNLLYVGGAGMVQSIFIKDQGLFRELEVIRKDTRKWKSAWPAIARWQEDVIKSHRRGALRKTPLGRRYRGARVTDHANIENQGFGGEIAKLALHYMYPHLKEHGAMLCNFIHDSYIVEMDRDESVNRHVAKIMKEAMIEAWHEGCKMVRVKDIPMPAEVACGFNWGDIEQDKVLFKV